MPLAETAVVAIIAKPVAKFLFKQAFGDSLAVSISESLLDTVAKAFTENKEQRDVEKRFRKMGEEVARKLWALFEVESGRLSDNDANAVALEVGQTIESTINTRLLIDTNLDAAQLERELLRVRPTQISMLGESGKALYSRALKELAPQIIALAPQLKDFQTKSVGEMLTQLDTVLALLDSILNGPAILAARYESSYLNAVQSKLDEMELFGAELPPGKKRHPLLKVAYVSLNLNQKHGSNISAENLFDQHLKTGGRLLITGDAGSGKSTLTRWLSLESTRYKLGLVSGNAAWEREEFDKNGLPVAKPVPWRDRIPFLVRLRDYPDGILPEPNAIPVKLEPALGTPPEGWVKEVLSQGRGLIIFDGIDEVPHAHRDRLQQDMEGYFRLYKETPFLLTARPAAVEDWDDWLQQKEFKQSNINPMSPAERMLLINRWHDAVRQAREKQGDTPEELKAITDKAEKLRAHLANDSRLSRLASYPLLCAVICALHHWKGENPLTGYWRMCEDFCRLLLHEREIDAQIQLGKFPACYSELDYDVKREIAQKIAMRMTDFGFNSVLPLEEAIEVTSPILEEVPGRKASEAEKTLGFMLERSGILRARQQNEIEFIHNIFKEFLIADALIKTQQLQLLEEKCLDNDWREVIVFAAASPTRGLATRLIRRLLSETDHQSRVLALRCREVARYFDESLAPQLQEVENSLFPPTTGEQAEAIGTLGNAFVNRLACREELTGEQAKACVVSLGHINTDTARVVAEGYIPDPRVFDELVRVINPLLVPKALESVLSAKYGADEKEDWREQISDLSPLENCSDIAVLNLHSTAINDENCKFFHDLTQLQSLNLDNTSISDLKSLQNLNQLIDLNLSSTSTSDLTPLQNLMQLKFLRLFNTSVSDLKPLQNLTHLQSLDLAYSLISDLKSLQNLTQLRDISLSYTSISDLNPLQDLTHLRVLDLSFTSISDLTPLQNLMQLKFLRLFNTSVSDLKPLQNLTQLQSLDLGYSPISDLKPLQNLTQLKSLDLGSTSISDLKPLHNLTQLQTLILGRKNRGQIKGIQGMKCKITWA
jgi:Leucine-rich repeat (LRR) protein